jgi:hypothetical protein
MILTKSAVRLIGAVVFLVFVVLAIHFLATPSAEASPAALTKTYTNPAYGFMLKMPADFAAYPPNATPGRDATGAPIGQAIVLQNSGGAMVQIEITADTRAQPGTNLTADDIVQSAPYFDLSHATPIQIAPGIIGVTFTDTEHSAFGSSTEAVWFAYRGNLYQVMADAKLGALLKSMIATWTFI